MVKQYGFRHLSTGDLLREAVKYGTPKGKEIDATMKEGKLVSSELLVELVKEKIERYNYKGRYLLDGFPRGQENIDVWNKIMGKWADIKGIFYFECEENELVNRLLGRAKTSGRVDDNEETIKKRIKTFKDETEPVIKSYGESGKLIRINAMNSIDKVSNDVKEALATLGIPVKAIKKDGAILVPVLGGPGSGKGTQCDKMK
jgi:adenylate kinase family enzyme